MRVVRSCVGRELRVLSVSEQTTHQTQIAASHQTQHPIRWIASACLLFFFLSIFSNILIWDLFINSIFFHFLLQLLHQTCTSKSIITPHLVINLSPLPFLFIVLLQLQYRMIKYTFDICFYALTLRSLHSFIQFLCVRDYYFRRTSPRAPIRFSTLC